MNYNNQCTLAQPIDFSGRGLNTGMKSSITVKPAPSGHGIVFCHITPDGEYTDIQASWKQVIPMPRCTCLSAGNGVFVRTVEHLLAACYACQIDNLLVEVHGKEIPLLDGSAEPFVAAFDQTGLRVLDAPKQLIKIVKPVRIESGDRYLQIEPSDNFYVDLGIRLDKWGEFRWQGELSPDTFKREMISARSFGRFHHGILAKMFTRFTDTPVCLGANFDNTVILVGGRAINRGGLRMPDEFIRHRVLDLVGDMMLAQGHLLGKITGFSTSHDFNRLLLETLFEDKNAWHLVEADLSQSAANRI